jgi:hypothetical protein
MIISSSLESSSIFRFFPFPPMSRDPDNNDQCCEDDAGRRRGRGGGGAWATEESLFSCTCISATKVAICTSSSLPVTPRERIRMRRRSRRLWEYAASTGIQRLNWMEYASYGLSPGRTQSQCDECIARTMAGFWSYAKSMRVKAIGREEGRAGDGVGDENQCGCVTRSFCSLVVASVMIVLGRGAYMPAAAERASRKDALRRGEASCGGAPRERWWPGQEQPPEATQCRLHCLRRHFLFAIQSPRDML